MQSPIRTVPAHIERPDYADTGIPLSEQLARRSSSIKVLSADEIKKMRHVSKVKVLSVLVCQRNLM